MILEWLVPVATFWTLAAMYLGGAPIRIDGGGAVRQLGGLVVSLVLYLGVYAALRAALGGLLGPTLTLVFATVGTSLLLPLECRLAFLVFGVKIRKASGSHGGHSAPAEA